MMGMWMRVLLVRFAIEAGGGAGDHGPGGDADAVVGMAMMLMVLEKRLKT